MKIETLKKELTRKRLRYLLKMDPDLIYIEKQLSLDGYKKSDIKSLLQYASGLMVEEKGKNSFVIKGFE